MFVSASNANAVSEANGNVTDSVNDHVTPTDNSSLMLLARIKASRVSLGLAALGFAPLLGLFFIASWDRPAYQFFPLALAGAAALAWRALSLAQPKADDRRSMIDGGRSKLGGTEGSQSSAILHPPSSILASAPGAPSSILSPLPLLFAASFLAANALWSPWLGFVAFLLGLATLLWSLGGKPLLKACVPAFLILLTILPPPLNGDVTLTVWLRTVAVHTSSVLLDWMQVTHAQDGNTLLLPGKTLLVEEACSGINSFILCNALCLFWGLWQRRSPWWFVFALPATSLFVVQGNIIRITAGAAAYYFRHWDLLSGRPHEILGLVLLIGYCLLIWSFDQCLLFLTSSRHSKPSGLAAPKPSVGGAPLAPVAASRESAALSPPEPTNQKIEGGRSKIEGTEVAPPSSIIHPPSSILSPSTLALALAVVGISVFAAHLFLGGHHGLVKLPSLSSVRELSLSLPDSLAGWQRTSSNSGDPSWAQTWGFRSANWQFQRNGLTATVAADYPLDGFHDVKNCYIGNGWQVLAEKEAILPPGGEDLHAIRLELQRSLQYAVVLHSVINREGQWLSAPLTVTSRFQADLGPPQKGYRVQIISVGYAPISPAAEADCQALFLQARQLLVQQLVDQLQTTASK